jgi:DMSO/TMAO reductase YedYZ molybdopterin-dependent catalytic subunit
MRGMGLLDDWFKALRQKATLAETQNPGAPRGDDRLPPGQVLTQKWPVLHAGPVPAFDPKTWDLAVTGEVETPLRFTWEEWGALPRVTKTTDFHCETRWSRLDNAWEGVAWDELERRARPRSSARFVVFHCEHGYTTNVRLEDLRHPGFILAMAHDGKPLPPEHGGPLRAVVPHLYAWKSAKWLRRIELRAADAPGYWEQRGYHDVGDPWLEQRFRDD